MAAPANELQKAIYDLLIADADVGALVGDRIYDLVPRDGDVFPYVTFGPSDEVNDDADCISADEYTIQLDVWSKKQGGYRECIEIVYAIKQALHEVEVDLPTHALAEMRIGLRRFIREGGKISHGVVIVEAMIENS